jgi:arylsulfatase A-like enzyme
MEYTDHHVGRLLDGLQRLNILDDTLVYYIIGGNGASAVGTLNGAYNEMANFNGLAAFFTRGARSASPARLDWEPGRPPGDGLEIGTHHAPILRNSGP